MNDFKRMIEEDIHSVILNEEEFGDQHVVEGREVVLLFDSETLTKRRAEGDLGLTEATELIFIHKDDLPPNLKSGSSLNIDGAEYLVDDVLGTTSLVQVAVHQNTHI